MAEAMSSSQIIDQNDKHGARNYTPLPIVITEAEGVWVKDPEGQSYNLPSVHSNSEGILNEGLLLSLTLTLKK